jgi:enoyl-CoA hydratase
VTATGFKALALTETCGIAHLRFERGDLGNRFDDKLDREFVRALVSLKERTELRALVISAEGKQFSVGGDFKQILEANVSAELRETLRRNAKILFETLIGFHFPVIAAVQGRAIGLGATIATASDLIVACRGAKFSDPHVVIGLAAGDGGVISWTQSIGMARAKRYLLTGDALRAEDAFAMGLVTDLVDTADDVLPKAMELAARIAALPPKGIEGTKRAFNRLTEQRRIEAFDLGLAYEMDSMQDPAVRDAISRIK